ncbi:MAG TPA: hypothetical protein VKB51_19175 [bacterium]|nr:hypothetical protein [bacterium]
MNRLQPVSFTVVVLGAFLVALLAGAIYFMAGISESTYLVTDGVHLATHYLDKPRYDMQLQGLIFSLSFLIAGALLLLMVMLPDQERRRGTYEEAPPQPRRRPEQAPAAQPAPAPAAEGAPQPQPAAQAAPPPSQQPSGSPLSIEEAEAAAAPSGPPPAPQAQAQPQRTGVSVEEEVLRSAASEDDLPMVDFGDSRFDDTGEEDVVYGAGRITEDAVWDFVQQYPDSAVKFLYRKTLDNKPLSPTEEDIYRNWEMRGMSRAKVREVVLEIMRWQSLPDNFPHEIWRELRDQIYELRTEQRRAR